jgi:hypothetical protein
LCDELCSHRDCRGFEKMTYEEALDILLFNKFEKDDRVQEAYQKIKPLISRNKVENNEENIQNMRFEIIRKFGTIDHFAFIAGISTNYLSQYLNGRILI